jgi:uracil-DNA glycosylase family 4
MQPEGKSGGLLIVGDWPGRAEEALGRPFVGPTARYVRQAVAQHWRGKVAYDYAIRCAPGNTQVKAKEIAACRGYMKTVVEDVKPERIVLLGPAAYASVLGRSPPQNSVSGAYGWYERSDGKTIPVFLVSSPGLIMGNRFLAQRFAADMEFALTAEVPPFTELLEVRTKLVHTAEDARVAAKKLLKSKWITYDVETFGRLYNKDFRIESCTVLGGDDSCSYTWTREALRSRRAKAWLRRVLQRRPAVTQNGKYDEQSVMLHLDAWPLPLVADTRLWRKQDDPEASAKLEVLAELVGMGGHKQAAQVATARVKKELMRQARGPQTTPSGKPRKYDEPLFDVEEHTLAQLRAGVEPDAFMFGFIDERILYKYNALDVFSTRAVYKKLLERRTPEQDFIWNEVLRDASRGVRMIEYWGFAVDRESVNNFASYCDSKISEAMLILDQYGDVNWASTPQLRKFLFEKLRLRVLKETKTGLASTDDEVLEALAGKHPAVDALRHLRKYQKLQSTYARGMLPHIRDDGRVHSSFLLDGAASGRLSSTEPNVQNIPRSKGSPDAKFARSCFVARPRYMLLEADFSQLELRIAAMLSGDEVMIADFRAGIDIHSNGARECGFVWKLTKEQWDAMSKEERDPYRSQIKTSIFGKLYGKTNRGLAHELGCPVEQIEEINKRIWGRYKRLDAWTKERLRESRRTGETWTYWKGRRARRRPIPKIGSQNDALRAHAERTSWNTPVQGSAAEFCTASFGPITDTIVAEGWDALVVCTVHDSILVEVKEEIFDDIARFVHGVMTSHDSGDVPIAVDLKRGPNWGSMEDYHLPEQRDPKKESANNGKEKSKERVRAGSRRSSVRDNRARA